MSRNSVLRISILIIVLILLASFVSFSQTSLQIGYGILRPSGDDQTPTGSALFSFRNSEGVLVWESAVSATQAISSGRVFVDQKGNTQTALALANPFDTDVSVEFVLRDSTGSEIDQETRVFLAHEHLPLFVSELFDLVRDDFTGSLTFETESGAIAAITLRSNLNPNNESVFATLPVVDLTQAEPSNPAPYLIFPQIGTGPDLSTQLILINPYAVSQNGTIDLFGSDGQPFSAKVNGVLTSEILYSIEANGVWQVDLTGKDSVQVGYARVTPDTGSSLPSGSAIFQYRSGDRVQSEAGVAAIEPTRRSRIFVDQVRTETGVAIASPNEKPQTATFRLLDRYGETIITTTRQFPAFGHLAIFVSQLFPGAIPAGFTGLMEIESVDPVVPVTLKLTTNQRKDAILTTLPIVDMTRQLAGGPVVFPQIGFGSGYETRLIVLNGGTSNTSSGSLSFFQSNGQSMSLPMGDETGSVFDFQINSGGGREFRPGNTAEVAEILLDVFQPDLTEIIVNQGETFRVRSFVVDSEGNPRDDFNLTYLSLDQSVALVDATGQIQGKKSGFSTLTVSAGGVIQTGTIGVVRLTGSNGNSPAKGVAADLSGRLYLAGSQDHVIYRAESLAEAPDIYAGKLQQDGLVNDDRLQSLFKNPAFIAYDQAKGWLYVSDAGNHVIRLVNPTGEVDTFAGTGNRGHIDGAAAIAQFDNPQGIAIDKRGRIWVADTGSHTIRMIDLSTKTVKTIAGMVNSPGTLDGKAEEARFSSPTGLAIQKETVIDQLSKNLFKPVKLIVADKGSGLIRRVSEDGSVETLTKGNVSNLISGTREYTGEQKLQFRDSHNEILKFTQPVDVATDPFGNIYVTEPDNQQIKTILNDGTIVPAVQPNSISASGIVFTGDGTLVVSDSLNTASEIKFGSPEITSVTPNTISNKGGTQITLTGKNLAPGTNVVIGGMVISQAIVKDTQTILLTTPNLPSGRTTLTVQNRGGISQTSIFVDAVPLESLETGQITTFAGGTTFIGDGDEAKDASIAFPFGVTIDSSGNLYVADTFNHRIRRIDSDTNIITTIAGTGSEGFSGDGGLATVSELGYPHAVAIDSIGDVFIADNGNSRIRRVDRETGVITTVAGIDQSGFWDDGGLATEIPLSSPEDLAVDKDGNLFIADTGNQRVRKVDRLSGIITTIAGTGDIFGEPGDGGPATEASLHNPTGIAFDGNSNLLIVDRNHHSIRQVDLSTGIITTIVGTGEKGSTGDGGLATLARMNFPTKISVDTTGDLFITDSGNERIRRVDTLTGAISTVAGNGNWGFSGDGGPATAATLNVPEGLSVDAAGNLFIADLENNRIRRVDGKTGIIDTVIGSGEVGISGDGGPATGATLAFPQGLAINANRSLFITEQDNNRVRKVDLSSGVITTLAGDGEPEAYGDGGPASEASLRLPVSLAVDNNDNLYIGTAARIRKIDLITGTITTVAGGSCDPFYDSCELGDGGPATEAAFFWPNGLTIDSSGNLYFADPFGDRVRKIDSSSGNISTIAGNGESGFSGDEGPAVDANLDSPSGVVVDEMGNLFITDTFNNRIRRIDSATGVISTYAGNGCDSFNDTICELDDGVSALEAGLSFPVGIALDPSGNLYVGVLDDLDWSTPMHRIRKIDIASGLVSTVAGGGNPPDGLGDAVSALDAILNLPDEIIFDQEGNLYISDSGNGRVRAVRRIVTPTP